MAKKGLRNKKIGHGRNDLCPCGSGRKYKKCCKPIPRMKTDKERQADIERRKESRGVSISKYSQYVQALARMNVRGEPRIDYGNLPDRVHIDDK